MKVPLESRFIAYDLIGPEAGPVVCFTHSLAADGGMWAEQVPALLAQGYRVLRIDMRGHGGSDPVAGDYTMRALAGDVAAVLDALGIARVHYIGLSIGGMLGQAFAVEHGAKLLSAMWCDTLPASPSSARDTWHQRMTTVREANSLAPIADATAERWLTDAFKARHPARWRADPRHHPGHHAGRLSWKLRGDPEFRLHRAVTIGSRADIGGLRVRGRGHSAGAESRPRRAGPRRAI